MKTYSFENGYGRTYTFEIVDKIPKGYEVWNIDFDNMIGGLIPLCQCYHGTRTVNVDTLKAIVVEDKATRDMLKRAVSRGIHAHTAGAQMARNFLKTISE